MIRHLHFAVALIPFAIGCATGQDSVPRVCLDAEQRFESCGFSAPAGFADLCEASPDSMGEVLALSCDELRDALDQLGKSDLPGFDRTEGQSCVFNVQCDRDLRLACRPTASTFESSAFSVPHECLVYGVKGEFCDDRFDCERGAPCVMGACDPDYDVPF
jgi:hypothetical protein